MNATEQDVLRAASMYYLQDMKMEVIARAPRHLAIDRLAADQAGAGDRPRRDHAAPGEHPRARAAARAGSAAFGISGLRRPGAPTRRRARRAARPGRRDHRRPAARARGSTPTWCSGVALGHHTRRGGAGTCSTSRPAAARSSSSTAPRTPARAASSTPATSSRPSARRSTPRSTTSRCRPSSTSRDTKAAMWRERSRAARARRAAPCGHRTVLGRRGGRRRALHVYSAGYLDDADIETLHRGGRRRRRLHGVPARGRQLAGRALNERATGPTPRELQRVPRRVCVVAGDNKVVPLLAALRAGVVTDLVVDELTATGLLDAAEPPHPRRVRTRVHG